MFSDKKLVNDVKERGKTEKRKTTEISKNPYFPTATSN
jgi:hypothetical protein